MSNEAKTTTVQVGDKTYTFSERAKVQKDSSVLENGDLEVRFIFKNGEVRTFVMPPSHPLFSKAALHGLNQKFGDAFAGVDDIEDMVDTFEDVAKTIEAGDWTEKRGGEGIAGTSVLAQALMAVTGKSKDDIKAFLKPLDAATKMALRSAEPVASKVREIEAAKTKKQTKTVDVSGLLAGLGAQ